MKQYLQTLAAKRKSKKKTAGSKLKGLLQRYKAKKKG